MALQRHIERDRCRLSRAIVGCRTDAAARQQHITARNDRANRLGNCLLVITNELRPAQFDATRTKQLEDLGEMPILALAAEHFVADDDQPDCHAESIQKLDRKSDVYRKSESV